MQLNQSRAELERHGIALAAITPDPVEVLASFARHHDIGFPLLSDLGGAVITSFGLLNPNIPTDHPRQRRGMPFPGAMLIGRDGRIRSKHFTGDLRHRAAAQNVLMDMPVATAPTAATADPPIAVALRVAATTVFPGQDIALRLSIAIEDGWHVYGPDAPAPYTGLGVSIVPSSRFSLSALQLPQGAVVEFANSGEALPVQSGAFEIDATLRVPWSPPPSMFAEIAPAVARRQLEVGDHHLAIEVAYQACSAVECAPPARLRLPFVLQMQGHAAAPG